jgi:mono/diheme cytochrome c family protein
MGVAVATAGLVTLALLAGGCKDGGKSGGVAITAADRKEAHDLFMTRCAACHGQFGRGDGPGAAGLNPKPRNYADAAWQKVVTDEEIEKAIVYGGAAVGKSPQMVANPDLQAKPGVVAALRNKVRSFADQ